MGQGLSRSLAPAGTLWKEESPARGQKGMRHAKERAGELRARTQADSGRLRGEASTLPGPQAVVAAAR